MNLGQQILFFFSALGAFNGIIISAYLILFKKSKSPATYFLGFLLLALSIRITKAIFSYFYPEIPKVYLQIGLSACFLIGPSLFYFTKSALSQAQSTPKYWKAIYGFWILSITIIGIAFPYQTNPYEWNHYFVHVIYIQWAIYVILSGWLLRHVVSKFFLPSENISPTEKSILSIYIGNLIIHIIYMLVFFGSFRGVYISGAIFFSLLLYLNIPLFMNRRKTSTVFLGNEELERYANKKINEAQALTLTEKLHNVILEKELYKNPDLKLNDLAKTINTSSHQLSQLLNDNLGKSFAAYINEYRINEACLLIGKEHGIKLEAIGYEVGFNSKSTFYAAFKKHKQMTPMLYKEQLSAI